MLEELKNNLIEDFENYLKENNLKINTDYINNKCCINNYLMSINYDIKNNTETPEEAETLENEYYNILNKYCFERGF